MQEEKKLELKTSHVVSKPPKSYTCPSCHRRVYLSIYAEWAFKECGVILHSCEYCGWISLWETKERFEKRTNGGHGKDAKEID